jgi:hypothetical protein
LNPKVDERVDAVGDLQVDAAAITAVTAIRASAGNKLLSPETQAAIAAAAGFDPHIDLIDELHRGNLA